MSSGMAEIFSRFGTTVWTVKMILLSVGIMSTIVLFRVAVIPYASSTVASVLSSVPSIAACIRTWLSPPYIYIILNFIILAIAAQNHLPLPKTTSTHVVAPSSKDGGELQTTVTEKETTEKDHQLAEETDEMVNQTEKEQPAEETGDETMNVEAEEERSEEPSLEETWVKIMEAQGKEQRRQLKKSDTWDTPPRVEVDDDDPANWARRELNKSATFKERAAAAREKSMEQEELNRRAEAFIRKFKLQRLESHQRVLNLVNAA